MKLAFYSEHQTTRYAIYEAKVGYLAYAFTMVEDMLIPSVRHQHCICPTASESVNGKGSDYASCREAIKRHMDQCNKTVADITQFLGLSPS